MFCSNYVSAVMTKNCSLICVFWDARDEICHFTHFAFAYIRPCHKAAILSRETKNALICFTTPSLIPMVSTARLGVVKQSSFGLPGQYGHRVTRANSKSCEQQCSL